MYQHFKLIQQISVNTLSVSRRQYAAVLINVLMTPIPESYAHRQDTGLQISSKPDGILLEKSRCRIAEQFRTSPG